jgi:hypothetical protein
MHKINYTIVHFSLTSLFWKNKKKAYEISLRLSVNPPYFLSL